MGLQQVKEAAARIAVDVGRAGLHALMPDDFEYYACSLELRDSSNALETVLNFPVMPNSISVNRVSQVNIKKSAAAVVSLVNNTFTPLSISIQGTFGRKLRLLVLPDGASPITGISGNNPQVNPVGLSIPGFDFAVKSGYGTLKVLESIIILSQQLDRFGKPRLLYFFNLALGHSFVVEALNFTQSQGQDSNMIWNYGLEMKAIAPAEITLGQDDLNKELRNILGLSVINKGVSRILDAIIPSNISGSYFKIGS